MTINDQYGRVITRPNQAPMKTTKAKRWMGTALALLLGTALSAQQDPQFTQYMFNMLALNPAYAGSSDRVSIKALTRHQWVGFEGAPTTQTLTVHSPVFHAVSYTHLWSVAKVISMIPTIRTRASPTWALA